MRRPLVPLAVLVLWGCQATTSRTTPSGVAPKPNVELREASGIARDGDRLLFVGDGTPGVFYSYALHTSDKPTGSGPILSQFTVARDHLTVYRLGNPDALDLEGIALLRPEYPLLVSERMRALLSSDRLVAEYPASMSEVGNRGLEGIAVRQDSDSTARIAVLWEGGFLERRDVPGQLDALPRLLETPLSPLVCVHTVPVNLQRSVTDEPCRDRAAMIELDVPIPPDSAQRFRAPDLVWLPDGNGFLVLLSSQNATSSSRIEYKYKWLQRFDLSGRRLGGAFNLCSVLPDPVRAGRAGNVEGLGWYELGKSVVLVNDHREPATVVILAVDPWPSTTPDECT